ncbi:MAG: RNA polymerase sigma factor [Steroidobacteraceae bacterium]
MREDAPLPANPLLTPQMLRALHAEAFGWSLSCCRGRREEAAEVLQSTYVRILEGRARFDGRSTARTFLFGVIRNVARSDWRWRLRRARYIQDGPPVDPPGEAPDAPESLATRAALRAALAALPTRQREVVELVFLRDCSIEEAAGILGIAIGSARTHYERAKARLRAALGLARAGAEGA